MEPNPNNPLENAAILAHNVIMCLNNKEELQKHEVLLYCSSCELLQKYFLSQNSILEKCNEMLERQKDDNNG